MAAERAQNLQDTFLNHVRKSKTPLTIFLVNGVKLQGVVTWFDNFCVLLRRDGHSQLVYKHAISTIMPGHPIQLFEGAEEPRRRRRPELEPRPPRRRCGPLEPAARRRIDRTRDGDRPLSAPSAGAERCRAPAEGERAPAARLEEAVGPRPRHRSRRGRSRASCRSAQIRPATYLGKGKVDEIRRPREEPARSASS